MRFSFKLIRSEELVFTRGTLEQLWELHPTIALDYLQDIKHQAEELFVEIQQSEQRQQGFSK
jgi:hypothetical protein